MPFEERPQAINHSNYPILPSGTVWREHRAGLQKIAPRSKNVPQGSKNRPTGSKFVPPSASKWALRVKD
jgi:hypothetical protein